MDEIAEMTTSDTLKLSAEVASRFRALDRFIILVEMYVAPAMIEELSQVLAYAKLQQRLEQLNVYSAGLLAHAIDLASICDVLQDGPVIVAADPDDDIFLRRAVASQASYIVSGDQHLLDLEAYAGTPFVRVRDFVDQCFPERNP